MMYGTTGKILRVDLTTGTWETETLTEEFYRLYPGGKALAGYMLLNELPPIPILLAQKISSSSLTVS
jgi:aldehyde:ferredoxin oxidoreductase